jgi:hypothetical protein
MSAMRPLHDVLQKLDREGVTQLHHARRKEIQGNQNNPISPRAAEIAGLAQWEKVWVMELAVQLVRKLDVVWVLL